MTTNQQKARDLPRYDTWAPTPFDTKGLCSGDIPADWRVLPTSQTRDSECLSRSNFDTVLELLASVNEDSWRVDRFGHWGPGWFEVILISPADEQALEIAGNIVARLENYPSLDDDKLSEMELDEARESWRNWYPPEERADLIREHSREAHWRTFAGLRAALKGELPPDFGIQERLNRR